MDSSGQLYIIMLGFLGSGKGTQVELLKNKFGYNSVSTGTLFRQEIRNATALGSVAKKYALQGKSTPDKETNHLIENTFKSIFVTSSVIILDGYPANLIQAKFLDDLLSEKSCNINLLINLIIEEHSILDRLKNRLVCPKCDATYNSKYKQPTKLSVCNFDNEKLVKREDDREDLILIRLKKQKSMQPLIIDYYKEKSLNIIEINANQSMQNVNNQISNSILNLFK